MTSKKLIIGIAEKTYSLICYQINTGIEFLAYQIYDKQTFTAKTLKCFLEAHDLPQIDTTIILGDQLYRILMIDKPHIMEAELSQAAKWLAKDLIKEDVDSVVVDAFPVTERVSKVGKLYIIIANKLFLQGLYDMCFEAGASLNTITIAEFGFLRLAPSENQVSMIVYSLDEGDIRVLIIYNGEIEFVRNIKIKTILTQTEELRGEEISLELNRSIDFYTTQFGDPVKEILCAPSTLFSENFVDMLRKQLTVNISLLYDNRFAKIFGDPGWNDHIMSLGLIAEESVENENASKS